MAILDRGGANEETVMTAAMGQSHHARGEAA
jgi:hypothetical protein